MGGWASPYDLLAEEFTQRRDEGCVIPAALWQRFAELNAETDGWNAERIDPLYDAVMALEPNAELAAREPNALAAIRALRPTGPRDMGWKPDEATLLDRLHGAWTGRCTGCALGKPVEGWTRERIKQYLQRLDDWPLYDFVSGRGEGGDVKFWSRNSLRETIAYMEPDDDIHYSLIALAVLEETGPAFTWENVFTAWRDRIPMGMICTAEKQAILNVLNYSSAWGSPATTPAFTRRYRNPYREWIGAQIRADGWAWACAGKPELAAEFAYRDACWTHERNGIYGEMFMAAMQAAAFVEQRPDRLVEIGLSEIPADCRLAQAVHRCREFIVDAADWEACMAKIEAMLPGMNWVHTINNALVCVMSLYYGKLDTLETPSIAVMAGWDTDCNGATVGSIVGAAAGQRNFRMDLAARLHDTVKPGIIGFTDTSMSELAQRTLTVWKTVDAYARTRE